MHNHDHEIPSAFLIRALARGESHPCEGCGGRMYVRAASGLCPFCANGQDRSRADRVRDAAASFPLRAAADEPFVPRLADQTVQAPGRWQRLGLRARRARRSAGRELRELSPSQPHPTTS
jgi:hypothetical protein